MNIIIENEIQNIPDPIVYINTLLENINLSDYELSVYFRLILKYHSSVALKVNLKQYEQFKLHPLTLSIIQDYYFYISKQLSIVPFLQEWKTIYNNKKFWTINITEQIKCLIKLNTAFISLFDGSYSNVLLHNRLKLAPFSNYHVEEMINRLTQVYKLFKYNFFYKIDCEILESEDFLYMTFKKQVEYMEYVFNKINTILTLYIGYFIEYNLYRNKLEDLLNIL